MHIVRLRVVLLLILAIFALSSCTKEAQNKFGRAINNWTGTNGVLEIYAGDRLVKRFLRVEKISTAIGTSSSDPRPYRFGYGYLDENFNGIVDPGESNVYFEFSDYSTSYVFYQAPSNMAEYIANQNKQ